MNTLNSIFKTIFVSGAIALASANANAVTINFAGTGWTMDVTINDTSPAGTFYNAFQDSNSARVGYSVFSNPVIAAPWNTATNPGINGITPDPNTLAGTYVLNAVAGYELSTLDLTAAGGYIGNTGKSGSVTLGAATTNYAFSAPILGTGTWTANAADLNFLSGQLSHAGSFSFSNNAGTAFGASMFGSRNTGPEFTIGVNKVPLPGVLALTLTGLLAFGLRRKFSKPNA